MLPYVSEHSPLGPHALGDFEPCRTLGPKNCIFVAGNLAVGGARVGPNIVRAEDRLDLLKGRDRRYFIKASVLLAFAL